VGGGGLRVNGIVINRRERERRKIVKVFVCVCVMERNVISCLGE